jgi:hypothetical protein
MTNLTLHTSLHQTPSLEDTKELYQKETDQNRGIHFTFLLCFD